MARKRKNKRKRKVAPDRRLKTETLLQGDDLMLGLWAEPSFKIATMRYNSFGWAPWQYQDYLDYCSALLEEVISLGDAIYVVLMSIDNYERWCQENECVIDSADSVMFYASSLSDKAVLFDRDVEKKLADLLAESSS